MAEAPCLRCVQLERESAPTRSQLGRCQVEVTGQNVVEGNQVSRYPKGVARLAGRLLPVSSGKFRNSAFVTERDSGLRDLFGAISLSFSAVGRQTDCPLPHYPPRRAATSPSRKSSTSSNSA